MNDKEKMIKFINSHDGTFENLVVGYILSNYSDFPASRISRFTRLLNDGVLIDRIEEGERALKISKERASFLVRYLKGEMYTTEEAAKEHAPVQLNNAQSIIDACENYGGV